MLKKLLLIALAVIVIPCPAQAQNEKAWLMAYGGAGDYGMYQLNRDIIDYNTSHVGTGYHFPTVKQGGALGGAIGYEIPSRWSFGLGFDRLLAKTKGSNSDGAMEYNFSSNGWKAFIEYGFGTIGQRALRLGVGAGIISENGILTLSQPDAAPEALRIWGSSPLYEGYGGGDWWLTQRIGIEGVAGYRYARIRAVKIEGGTLITGNGEATSIDFSGPYLRLGLKLAAKGI